MPPKIRSVSPVSHTTTRHMAAGRQSTPEGACALVGGAQPPWRTCYVTAIERGCVFVCVCECVRERGAEMIVNVCVRAQGRVTEEA